MPSFSSNRPMISSTPISFRKYLSRNVCSYLKKFCNFTPSNIGTEISNDINILIVFFPTSLIYHVSAHLNQQLHQKPHIILQITYPNVFICSMCIALHPITNAKGTNRLFRFLHGITHIQTALHAY